MHNPKNRTRHARGGHRHAGIALFQGPRRGVFLISEVPLYSHAHNPGPCMSVLPVQGYLTHEKYRGSSLTRRTGVPHYKKVQGYLTRQKYRGTSPVRSTGVPHSSEVQGYLTHQKYRGYLIHKKHETGHARRGDRHAGHAALPLALLGTGARRNPAPCGTNQGN